MTGAPWWIEILASGLVAAIVTALVSFWYSRHRFREEIAIQLVTWSDDLFLRTISLAHSVDLLIEEDTAARLAETDAKSEEFLALVNSHSMRMKVHFGFGEGVEYSFYLALVDAYQEVLHILTAGADTDDSPKPAIAALIERRITPLRARLMQRLEDVVSLPDGLQEIVSALTRRRATTARSDRITPTPRPPG